MRGLHAVETDHPIDLTVWWTTAERGTAEKRARHTAASTRNIRRRRYPPTRFDSGNFPRRRKAPIPHAPKASSASVPGSGTLLLHANPVQAVFVGGVGTHESRM